MANSKLLGTKFKLHRKVLEQIKTALEQYGTNSKKLKGYKRAMYVTQKAERDPASKLPLLTYETTKRIYHDITHLDLDDKANIPSYELMGGDFMREWCKFTLNKARHELKAKQQIKKDTGQKMIDKDKDDEDMTKIEINPMNTSDDRDLRAPAVELMESIEKIKTLYRKIL